MSLQIPKRIAWKQINYGIKRTIDDINGGKYKALEDTPAYNKMMSRLRERIHEFRLADEGVVETSTLESIFKNYELSSWLAQSLSRDDLERLADHLSYPAFETELMRVPEIAKSRVEPGTIRYPIPVIGKNGDMLTVAVTQKEFDKLLGEEKCVR